MRDTVIGMLHKLGTGSGLGLIMPQISPLTMYGPLLFPRVAEAHKELRLSRDPVAASFVLLGAPFVWHGISWMH